MPKKYQIYPVPTRLEFDYVFKFKIERGENCINCARCTKVCIYEAHQRRVDDPRQMAEPNTVVCRNCFRCIQECPRGALEKSLNTDFTDFGGGFWRPDMCLSLWKQAQDGKVPVSGAGYRGPFSGTGFDSMWTDMSEIVRPTRDGIHGREYISTMVSIGRRLNHLTFDSAGRLLSQVPDTVDIPIPVLFDTTVEHTTSAIKLAMLDAAAELDTLVIMPVADISNDIKKYQSTLIPHLRTEEVASNAAIMEKARLISIEYDANLLAGFSEFKRKIEQLSKALIMIRVPAAPGVESVVLRLAQAGTDIVHIVADYRGLETGNPGVRLLKDVIRAVHLELVKNQIRDEITIVASGGIAMAEHVPKSMLCGADLVATDIPLLIALGARIYEEPCKAVILPPELAGLTLAVMKQRLVNLMCAWHSQILEMMGAMGIREVRRLRGETGRAIFFEEIDRATFGKLFKKEKR